MRRSLYLSKRGIASTDGGMRRILKRPLPIDKYYRQAVQSGTYIGNDEAEKGLPPIRESEHEMRFRRQQYPFEYETLLLNPPIVEPPKMPAKYLRQQEDKQRVHDTSKSTIRKRLMQNYLKTRVGAPYYTNNEEMTSDEYYRKLLGIAAPSSSSSMGQKSSVLNKAYVVAVKQQELMRRQDGLNEEESMEIVEELLKEAQEEETEQSRGVQTRVQEWKEKQQAAAAAAAAEEDAMTESSEKTTLPPSFVDDEEEKDDDVDWDSLPSILHSKPRTIQGIAIWSRKLQAVPYNQWTIGAATALDHFIARSILEITEATWDTILEGTDPSLKSIGRDIVMVRRTLFPETNPMEEEQEYDDITDDDPEDDNDDLEGDKSIEELLASLGGLDHQEEPKKTDDTVSQQQKIDTLRSELQDWRHRHWEKEPYNEWKPKIQNDFQHWLQNYVELFMPEASLEEIDFKETRKALFSVPPLSEEESNTFWDSIQDETSASAFLSEVQQKNTIEDADDEMTHKLQTFSTALSFDEQVSKLVHLSTLRPIYDEYDSNQPQTRLSFLERHADKLLQGMPLEHFVPADEGPISGQDLIDWGYAITAAKSIANDNNKDDLMIVNTEDRFVMQTLPYDASFTKHRKNMMVAWNIHKASRARYEEFLFSKGRLGLRYDDQMEMDDKNGE